MFFKRTSEEKSAKSGLFSRMKVALGATRNNLVGRIESVLSSRPKIDEDALDELEGTLLSADLGIQVAEKIMSAIRDKKSRKELETAEDAKEEIKNQLLSILSGRPTLGKEEVNGGIQVWMVVGVNGTGKTTTVGKLASQVAATGASVLVCAADTFRPAAIEQLSIWAERSGADLVKSKTGADPSSVLHDALDAAASRKRDLVIVDTAGRLHTKGNLMQELEKNAPRCCEKDSRRASGSASCD